MSNEKKLLITTIALGAMVPISMFGLSFITEAFLVLGMYCGLSALLCLAVFLDVKAANPPKLIPIGIGMVLFALIIIDGVDFYTGFTIPLSVLYVVIGLIVLIKGIKDRYDEKHADKPKKNKKINKNIYIGIGLIAGGFVLTFVFFAIYRLLMGISYLMIVAGIVFLGRGIAQRSSSATATYSDSTPSTNENTINRNTAVNTSSGINNNTVSYTNHKHYYCARCHKSLEDLDPSLVVEYEGVKVCADCKAAIDKEIVDQHRICSMCGVDLPVEHMHIIDNVMICHSCFLKRYGVIDAYNEDEFGLSLDEAVNNIRKQIIAKISKKPAVEFELCSFLWDDAAKCFPDARMKWDGVWIKLNLLTGKISADASTYPNQFGANYSDHYSVSAAEFNEIAHRYNLSRELKAFKSDEDWSKIFNDQLKTIVSSADIAIKLKEEERQKELIRHYSVKLPKEYADLSPDMVITEVTLVLSQMYCVRNLSVRNENGKYHIEYHCVSHLSPECKTYSRELSSAEAVWLERKIDSVVKKQDYSTWTSIPGGDLMDIEIVRSKGKCVSKHRIKPLNKYSELESELSNFAQYGSVYETSE